MGVSVAGTGVFVAGSGVSVGSGSVSVGGTVVSVAISCSVASDAANGLQATSSKKIPVVIRPSFSIDILYPFRVRSVDPIKDQTDKFVATISE